jgi:cyclase
MPCLLVENGGLVKTVRFSKSRYVGDPINSVRIFNEKEVDELVVLDITAAREGREPSFGLVEELAGECFMPLTYGGGIRSIDHIERLVRLGVEKVSLNSHALTDLSLISGAAATFGSQSIVVSIDARRTLFGKYRTFTFSGRRDLHLEPNEAARRVEEAGAGEILLNSIDRDGTMRGCDIELIRSVADAVRIPVIACGGVGNLGDVAKAVKEGHASAVAAGSLFVFHGKHRAVLINFPTQEQLRQVLQSA